MPAVFVTSASYADSTTPVHCCCCHRPVKTKAEVTWLPGHWDETCSSCDECTRAWQQRFASVVACGGASGKRYGSCRLHVGFIRIEETPDMLARLRKKDEPSAQPSVAASKISTTMRIPQPIDRVAARVAPLNK